MKTIAAMMLAGSFLLVQPAFAGVVVAPEGGAEKAPKAKKEKADKGDKGAAGAGAEKKDDTKKDEPKKGGW